MAAVAAVCAAPTTGQLFSPPAPGKSDRTDRRLRSPTAIGLGPPRSSSSYFPSHPFPMDGTLARGPKNRKCVGYARSEVRHRTLDVCVRLAPHARRTRPLRTYGVLDFPGAATSCATTCRGHRCDTETLIRPTSRTGEL